MEEQENPTSEEEKDVSGVIKLLRTYVSDVHFVVDLDAKSVVLLEEGLRDAVLPASDEIGGEGGEFIVDVFYPMLKDFVSRLDAGSDGKREES